MMKTLFLTTALVFSGQMAFSATVADQVVDQLRVDGFQNIEVADRDGTVKVEGVRDGMKIEAVYDSSTGEKLKEEFGRSDDRDTRLSDDDGTDDQGMHNDDDGNDDGKDDGPHDRDHDRDHNADHDRGDDHGGDRGGDGGGDGGEGGGEGHGGGDD